MKNYTIDDIKRLCRESYSYASVLRGLGLADVGGNYKTLKTKIREHSIDISHFTGQGYNKGIHKDNADYKNKSSLRKKLITIRGNRCEGCLLEKWRGQTIAIEMHHIDGDRSHNEDSNLQLLCPNCHAITPNFRGKNIKRTGSPTGSRQET